MSGGAVQEGPAVGGARGPLLHTRAAPLAGPSASKGNSENAGSRGPQRGFGLEGPARAGPVVFCSRVSAAARSHWVPPPRPRPRPPGLRWPRTDGKRALCGRPDAELGEAPRPSSSFCSCT